LVGEKVFGDKKASDLAITVQEGNFHFFIDPVTNLPLGASYQTVGQQGPMEVEEFWSDFREVAGIKVAGTTVSKANGKQSAKIIVKELEANMPVDEKLFQK
jgi:hypothetical protein